MVTASALPWVFDVLVVVGCVLPFPWFGTAVFAAGDSLRGLKVILRGIDHQSFDSTHRFGVW